MQRSESNPCRMYVKRAISLFLLSILFIHPIDTIHKHYVYISVFLYFILVFEKIYLLYSDNVLWPFSVGINCYIVKCRTSLKIQHEYLFIMRCICVFDCEKARTREKEKKINEQTIKHSCDASSRGTRCLILRPRYR